MQIGLGLSLFACSGDGAGAAIAKNIMVSEVLALVTAVTGYVSLRLWAASGRPGMWPTVCGVLFLIHPAWTVSAIHGDCGREKLFLSYIITGFAGAWVFAQWQTGLLTKAGASPSPTKPNAGGDIRFPAGELPRSEGITDQIPHKPGKLAPGFQAETDIRSFFRADSSVLGAVLWLVAAVGIGLFGYEQYAWYDREFSKPEPNWVLGPLYFLAVASPEHEWIGYALLAIAIPCLLAVLRWPNRWTALLSSYTVVVWLLPGTIKALMTP
jgi:hypothetical protein